MKNKNSNTKKIYRISKWFTLILLVLYLLEAILYRRGVLPRHSDFVDIFIHLILILAAVMDIKVALHDENPPKTEA